MEAVWNVLGTEQAMTIVLGVIGLFFAWLRGMEKVQAYKLSRLVQFVEQGIRNTYEEYVRTVKKKAKDGKLPEAARKKAKDMAIEAAVGYAKSEGVDLVKEIGKDYLPVLVEKVLARMKAGTA